MTKENLLKIPEVVEEIKRHLWCESEKAGHDVGYEWAAEDWVSKYSKAWVEYHMPEEKTGVAKTLKKRPVAKKTVFQKRSAKKYF